MFLCCKLKNLKKPEKNTSLIPGLAKVELWLLFALQIFSCMWIFSVKIIRIIYTWPEKTHFVFQGGEEAHKGGEFWNVKVKGWIGDELSWRIFKYLDVKYGQDNYCGSKHCRQFSEGLLYRLYRILYTPLTFQYFTIPALQKLKTQIQHFSTHPDGSRMCGKKSDFSLELFSSLEPGIKLVWPKIGLG